MTPEEKIKETCLDMGAKAVGIASVETVNRFVPYGNRPDDMLPEARSVIVMGNQGPTAGAWKATSQRVLGNIGYSRGQLPALARRLAHSIEETFGYYAIPIPSEMRVGHYPSMSLKLCAEMAGLGARSMAAGIILNPQYGLLYFNGVITTMPLKADGPLDSPVCPDGACIRMWDKKRTTPCLSSCPDCLSGEIQNNKIGWMEYRQDCCFPRAQTTSVDAFQKLLLQAIDEPDSDRRKSILFGSHFVRAVRSIAHSSELTAQCFNCVKRCPVVQGRVGKLK